MAKHNLVNHAFLVNATLLNNTKSTSVDLAGCVQNIKIQHSYLKNVFPLFVIDLKLTEALRDEIRDNLCNIFLGIYAYNAGGENSVENEDTSEVDIIDVVYEGEIRLYEKPFTTTAAKAEEDNTEGDDTITQSESAPFVLYTVAGVPENLIAANEDIINTVYKNAESIDAVINILTETNREIKLHIQESNVKKVYRNIIIPPYNLVPALQYIDTVYGIYDDPANIYFTNNDCYFYSPLSYNIPTGNTIECTVYDTNSTADLPEMSMPSMDDNGNIYLSYRGLPVFVNGGQTSAHATGDKVIFYGYDDNFNLITREAENSESYKKTRYFWGDTGKKYDETGFMDIAKLTSSMTLTISNLNPNLITPLTVLKMLCPKYPAAQGEYLMGEASVVFGSGDGKHFTDTIYIHTAKKN